MIIPLYGVLIVYGILFLIFLIFLGVNIYHLHATNTFTPASIAVLVIVIVLSIAIIAVTAYLLKDVDWSINVFLPPGSGSVEF